MNRDLNEPIPELKPQEGFQFSYWKMETSREERDYLDVEAEIWPDTPLGLTRMMGVYTFWFEGDFLKIGKAGPSSNARFLSQHYNPRSARSTLAASILLDRRMQEKGITENNVGDWIKNNCRRVDILLDSDLGIFTLELIEAALHYKYEPIYEGFATQR